MLSIGFISKYILCLCCLSCIYSCLLAQDSVEKKSALSFSGFIEAYYCYDFAKPSDHEKASFLFNHNRHNEITINLALAALAYKDSTIRANFAIMAGTYPQYNLAAEPDLLQHVYQANAGVKLAKRKELWLDAGIFPSHIGFESAISKDCWTLTRSMLAEGSPYYEAGVKASYITSDQKWYLAVLFLNGWQRITRMDGNNTPSFGTQVTYTPTDKFSINSSTFIGNDRPDSIRKWRYFHNLYSLFQLSKSLGITLGVDVGLEQKQKSLPDLNTWFSPVLILRYQNRNWTVAARAEYYQDNKGVIMPLINTAPFQMQGYSINVDCNLYKNVLLRIEGRALRNSTAYFEKQGALSSNNFFITTALSIAFD